MELNPPLTYERSSLFSRLIFGPKTKAAFSRILQAIGGISPAASFGLRTSLSEAAFPLRPWKEDTEPRLRDDIASYTPLFQTAATNFAKVVSAYQAETEWPIARTYNGLFETVDAELYYCMIRFFKPDLVIEIGAGNSTWFAHDAIRKNGTGELLAIDPSPRLVLPKECQHQRRFVQDVEPSLFSNLERNDILFIDSSHTGDEATYFLDHVYPRLGSGAFIHHHDILFPFRGYTSYEPNWEQFTEQKTVLEFLRMNQESYRIFTSSAFVHYEMPDIVLRLIPSKRFAPRRAGGSLWIRKEV